MNEYKLVGVLPGGRGSPGNIPPAAFESLCVGVESYISINQLNPKCGNIIGKKDLMQLVNSVVSRNTGENIECNYKLMHWISLYKGIDLTVTKMSNQEARRIDWTRAKFLNMWFNMWENNLAALGFATRADGAKGIMIPPDQLLHILNFDKTAMSLDGSGTTAGRRQKAVWYNPNFPTGFDPSWSSLCRLGICSSTNLRLRRLVPIFYGIFELAGAQTQETKKLVIFWLQKNSFCHTSR